ncbi:MAG: molybdopterin-dependent oxidoreductase [Rhodobacteraceae bacterium]|nr:molybdopterin-dependent oxidoreductase [Paracoccaceae bacterium]
MSGYSLAHWGTFRVTSDDAGSPALSPFDCDPDPSPIGLDQWSPEVLATRVRRPCVRRGWLEARAAGGPGGAGRMTGADRGRDAFVEMDWDRALDLVASELRRVRDTHGNRAIFGGSYGWASAGRFHHAQSQLHRFLNTIGGYVRHVDNYSYAAANVIMPHVVAPMDRLTLSHSDWSQIAAHTRLFVAFGGIPIKNAQVSGGGVARHAVPGGLRAMAAAGVRVVNIGPVADNTGETAAEWLPCRPGTDTAVMLAMMHVLLTEGLHDRVFLARCCTGFERFAPYLLGETDGQPKTPAWAEGLSGLAAGTIAQLARDMAATRSMINVSWSMQRAEAGEQPFWAVVVLAAMLGQIGKPGGGFGLGYGATNLMGSSEVLSAHPTLPQGARGVQDFIPVARIADMLQNPGAEFAYDGGTYRYPDIRLVYWAGGNPFHHHQDLGRLRQAWTRPETVIVHEPFWTATARHADIVLPVTTALERDDIGCSTRGGYMVAMRQAREPLDGARDDHAIFALLSERMGCAAAFTEGRDTMGWLRHLYEATRGENLRRGVELPSFVDFWESGLFDMTGHAAPVTMLADFVADPVTHPLATPSGRIEIWSERIAAMGLPDVPPHPAWIDRREWLGSALTARFPLHLLTDQPERRLHSQLDPAPHSRAGKRHGREVVHMNPVDIARHGLTDGAVAELWNDRGRCLAAVQANARVMPGVARLNTGAWYDPDPDTGLDRHGNPNVLTADRAASSLSQGCAAQSCLIAIRPWEGPLPPVRAYEPPELLADPTEG